MLMCNFRWLRLSTPLLLLAASTAGPSFLYANPYHLSVAQVTERQVQAPPANNTARLTILSLGKLLPSSSTDYQFGTISALQTTPIEHTFTLRNDNSISVTLDHLQPSCGCTTAVVGGEAEKMAHVIAPGKTLQVHVSIDPGHLSAGPITKTVWVYLKGQPDAAAALQIIGTMQAAVTFSPTFLDFGRVPRGNTPSRLLTVTLDPQLATATPPRLSLSISDLQITTLQDSDKINKKLNSNTIAEGAKEASETKRTAFTYRLALLPQAHLGQMTGIVALSPPSDGTAPIHALQAVSVPIVGEVVGELSASPSAVAFSTVTQGQPSTMFLILTATSAEALQNLRARSLTSTISVNLSDAPAPQPNGKALSLTPLQRVLSVTAEPASSVGSLQTQVIVTTGHKQELVLPVFLSVVASTNR